MGQSWWSRMLMDYVRAGSSSRPSHRFAPGLESLDERLAPSVTATFSPGTGVLSIVGDKLDNNITISRDNAGHILVNKGAVSIVGGTPTVANVTLVQAFGLAGNDTIALDESNGALPAATLIGGSGNDILTGGSGADQLFGQAGDDTLLGKGGNDILHGATGNDTLIAGAGDDQVFGGGGNDLMIWNPGDGTDLNEGGAGNDTVQVNGGNGAEKFSVTPNGTRVRFDRTDPAPFSIDIGTSEKLVLNANGGDDTFTGSNGLSTLISLTVDGGAGNDTITGGDGNDTLLGGDGNDTVNGGRGNDSIFLGTGDDSFTWNPGDGSDLVEGQAGADTMIFNGANIAEKVDISANGQRVRFTRDVASIVMDLNGIERIGFNALGGADTVTVNDLTGTDLQEVSIGLGSSIGGGDGAADNVIVTGTTGDDVITASGDANQMTVTGVAAKVIVTGAEAANDRLTIQGLAGDDVIDGTGLLTGAAAFFADGNQGDDVLMGSANNDSLSGSDGDDILIGGAGQDVLDGGAGDNVLFQ